MVVHGLVDSHMFSNKPQIFTPDVIVVDELEETVRGAGGFGSTGGFGGSLPGINGVVAGTPSA